MSEDIPMKKCTGPCGQEYPATTEYWNKAKEGKYELNSKCKKCQSQRAKELYYTPDQQKKKHARYQAHKEEILAKDKIRRQENAEQIKASAKTRYQKNRSSLLNNKREYYQKNKEQIQSYRNQPEIQQRDRTQAKIRRNRPETKERDQIRTKAYRARPEIRERDKARQKAYYSRPEIRERYRAWEKERRLQPESRDRYRQKDHKRRARHMSVKGTYTPTQIQTKLKQQKHKCYYCNTRLKKTKGRYIYHIEHTFPLSRVAGTDIPANSIDYLVLSCPTCNLSKGDKFPWEWPEGGRLL